MSQQPIQVGAIGATIRITVADPDGNALDISTCTRTNNLYLRSPTNRVLIKTPTFVTDGTNGQIEYDTISGDLDVAGNWRAQFKLVMGGDTIPTSVTNFPVESNIYP